jgi:hypothetical protein
MVFQAAIKAGIGGHVVSGIAQKNGFAFRN